jgi:hypothetical protein
LSLTRPVGAACALLAACSLVPALLVLGTGALLLLAVPTTGAAALVVGVAALAVPGVLTLAAAALVTGRPEGAALTVLGAAVAVAATLTGAVGPGLPAPAALLVVVPVGASAAAAVLVTHRPVVVTPDLERAAVLAGAFLLAAHGLTLLAGLPRGGADVATPAVVAVVTAGIAAWACRTARPGVVSPFVAAAAMALLTTVLAVRTGVDPLPAAAVTATLAGVAAHRTVLFVRTRTVQASNLAKCD